MNHRGGFRGNGHFWAGMGDPLLRDAPPLFGLRFHATLRLAAALTLIFEW
jgi:hypothetical protein